MTTTTKTKTAPRKKTDLELKIEKEQLNLNSKILDLVEKDALLQSELLIIFVRAVFMQELIKTEVSGRFKKNDLFAPGVTYAQGRNLEGLLISKDKLLSNLYLKDVLWALRVTRHYVSIRESFTEQVHFFLINNCFEHLKMIGESNTSPSRKRSLRLFLWHRQDLNRMMNEVESLFARK